MAGLQGCRVADIAGHWQRLPLMACHMPHATRVADSLVHVYGIHYATNQQYQWIMNMLVAQFLINMQTCTQIHAHTLTHMCVSHAHVRVCVAARPITCNACLIINRPHLHYHALRLFSN